MLGFLRRRMKIIMWILVVGITIPFVFWGVGARFSGRDDRPRVAGELFGEEISLAEFDDSYRAVAVNAYLTRSNLDREQINKVAWDRLMLLREAVKAGISVSDGELAQTITRQFSQDGKFDQKLYENVLRLMGITPSLYERWTRESLMVMRLNELVRQFAWLPDSEIKRQIWKDKTEYVIDYAVFTPEEVSGDISVSGEELAAYYQDNRSSYTAPEKANAEYVLISWDAAIEPTQVTEEELKSYYDEHQDEFKHGERVRARHILFKTRPAPKKKEEEKGLFEKIFGSDEAEDPAELEKRAEQKAQDVLEKVKKGADFEEMAGRYSEDEKTRDKGGDLGFIERKDMPAAFSNKAFSINKGEVSDIIKTWQGCHIIKAGEKQEAGVKEFSEVREDISKKLEREKQKNAEAGEKQIAYTRAVDVSLALVDTPDLRKLAERFSLQVKETGPISMNDDIEGIGRSREFARAAFETETGSFSDIVEIRDKGYCIIVPKEKFEESVKPLNEVRGEIEKKIKEDKAMEAAVEAAESKREQVAKQIKEGTGFNAACEKLGISVKESKPFLPRGFIPELGYEPELIRSVQNLKPGDVSEVFRIKKGACFFSVVKEKEPAEEEVARELEQYKARSLRMEEGKIAAEWNRWLEQKARMIDSISMLQPEGS